MKHQEVTDKDEMKERKTHILPELFEKKIEKCNFGFFCSKMHPDFFLDCNDKIFEDDFLEQRRQIFF